MPCNSRCRGTRRTTGRAWSRLTAAVDALNSRSGRARHAVGGGFQAALLAHVGEGALRDLMPEVAAGTPTTGVAPLAVLGGHPDDAPADRVHARWAARSATAAAVVCPRDQLSMPAEEGIGRDQGVPVTASPSPEARGLGGPAPALGVGDPEPARTELLSADAILFLERVTDVTRLLVDPARDGHDEELQHLGNRRQTGRAEQRLSAVTNVATRRASSVESARRTASIGFLDSTRSSSRRGRSMTVHPRPRGEHARLPLFHWAIAGSSGRVDQGRC